MLELLKTYLSLVIVIPSVFFVGLYLSTQLHWLQILKLPQALRLFTAKPENTTKKANFSSFSALTAVLGGNLGTGNIAGIAVALSTGGPGSLFWMWIMAILGAIVKFAGCFLGVMYRKSNGKSFVGGPMYYIADGLKLTWLAKIFCVFTIFSSFTVGNLVQINSISLPLKSAGVSPIFIGIVLSVVVGYIMTKGVKAFTRSTVILVPIMTVLYLGACLIILSFNVQQLPSVVKLILTSAFTGDSLLGGVLGITVLDTIRVGFDRGLFATDAGIGIAPMLHSQVACDGNKHKTAYQQGLAAIVAPFFVMLICMVTGMVIIVTGVWQMPGSESTNSCILAFQIGFDGELYGYVVILTLCLFALTTMLTWAHCAELAVKYLHSGPAPLAIYRIIFIVMVPLGVHFQVRTVWSIADLALNSMLLINLFSILMLGKQVFGQVTEILTNKEKSCNFLKKSLF